MLAIIRRFNEQHPHIQVSMQRTDWATYYNKLFVAGLGGRAPEVFVIHTDTLSRFIRANLVRQVDDLVGGADGVDLADVDANVWDSVEHEGRHYALPLDVHPLGLFYNRPLFRRAGISAPPTNRQEFIAALQKVKALNEPSTWGFVYTWQRINVWALIAQNQGDIFTPDGLATTINSPENIETFQFCADLVKQGFAPPPQDFDSWIGFRQGRVAMTFHGIFMLPDLQRQEDLDWAAAPMPVLFDKPATWANSHNLCIAPDLTGRELAAAKTFITYLSDHSLDWAAGGQVPVRKSLRASPRFQQMEAQREFARQIPYLSYMPNVPFVLEYLAEFDYALERTLRGSVTPAVALDGAAKNIARVIERYYGKDALADARRRADGAAAKERP